MSRFDPRKLLAVGLVSVAWTLYSLARLNLNAGYWDIFWPQFIQGAGLALLFVPLTTATMDPIAKEEMGNATSMFNLMRNLGGGTGIACATTYLFRRQQIHVHSLGAHVNSGNPQARTMLRGMRAAMMAHGADSHLALQRAQAGLWGMVQRHAAVAAFMDAFLAMAMVFLLVLPLLLLMDRPKHHARGGAMH